MRKFTIVLGIALIALVLFGVYTNWVNSQRMEEETKARKEQARIDLKKAEQWIAAGKIDEALYLIRQYKPEMESRTQEGYQWLVLFVKGAEKQKDIAQLAALYDFNPQSFAQNEEASLLIANYLVSNGKLEAYNQLRHFWTNRETKRGNWTVLDADYLLFVGKKEDATSLLESQNLEGPSETERLIRLALLQVNDNPKEAWKSLSKVSQNSDIRAYRARILEGAGKISGAHSEYQAALKLFPESTFLRDELAEFYVRQKQFSKAASVWEEMLKGKTLDSVWVKALFWNKAASPITIEMKGRKPVPGNLEPLIAYYIRLKPGQFWNENEYQKLGNASEFLKTEQSTFWLRVIQLLKDQKQKEAFELLTYNPFTEVSWNPELEKELIHTQDFAGAFAKAGWYEAALALQTPDSDPYYMTLAYKENQGVEEALKFAKNHPSPALIELHQNLAELASRAFEEKNWPRAKALTEQLLLDYPDNPTLHDNLNTINQEIELVTHH